MSVMVATKKPLLVKLAATVERPLAQGYACCDESKLITQWSSGEGKTSGGGHPMSPWGQLSKGFQQERNPSHPLMIITRRNGQGVK